MDGQQTRQAAFGQLHGTSSALKTTWRDRAWMASLVLVTVLAYGRHLGWWFTAPDTFPLIETSRVSSWADLWAVLSQPMMAGNGFTDLGLFYRPVTSLTFALDYAIWGLDPFGYHLTNLLLHLAAVLLAYLLVLRVAHEHRGIAVLTAGLFAVHPVVAESLPGIARRQDALLTVFVLLSILGYLAWRRGGRHAKAYLAGSLVAAVLAFGSKELALVLPGILLAHAFLVEQQGDPLGLKRVARSLRAAFPYLLVTAAWMALRAPIVGGLGGYYERPRFEKLGVVDYTTDLWARYLTSLVPSIRVLGENHGLEAAGMLLLLAGLVVSVALVALGAYRGRLVKLWRDGRAALATPTGAVLVWCTAWILMGGVLFLITRTFSERSSYLFLVPTSLILATLIVRSVEAAGPLVSVQPGPPGTRQGPGDRARLGGATAVVLGALVVTTVWVSPGVHGYEEWEESATFHQEFTTEFTRVVDEHAPDGAQIILYDRLRKIHAHEDQWPGVISEAHVKDYSLHAWLVLQLGEDRVSGVETRSMVAVDHTPSRVHFDWGIPEEGVFEMDADYYR